MKKIIAILMALCVCLSMTALLASCNGAGTDETTTAAAEGEGEGATTVAVVPNPDPIILRPADCTIVNGGTADELKIEDGGNLGYWKAGNKATWTISIPKDGKYKVTLNYAKGTTQDAEVKVVVGDKNVAARVAPTADWTTYVDFELGTIDLTTADTSLTVEPGDMPESDLMNLLTLTLTYVE